MTHTLVGISDATKNTLSSVYVLTSNPLTTANTLDIWYVGGGSDGSYVDIKNRKVVNYNPGGWKLNLRDYGDSLHIWFQGGPPHADTWGPAIFPRGGDAAFSCLQIEDMTQDETPSSWIPYSQTRAAD